MRDMDDMLDKMAFYEFVNEVKELVPDYFFEYNIVSIDTSSVNKGNGVVLTGMSIRLDGENIAPNIYLDDYYKQYKNGSGMDKILSDIKNTYDNARQQMHQENYDVDMSNIEGRIFMKAVNYEMNKDMLLDTPHIRQADLAITFRILVSKNEAGIASAQLTNREFLQMDKGISELYDIAKENTKKLFPAAIHPMKSMIEDLMGTEIGDELSGPEMYVLTNDVGVHGATCMFYDNVLEDAKKMIGDYYILPSSQHEVILLQKQDGMEPEQLREMVKDINRQELDVKDILSNEVYEYDDKEKQLKIAGPDREKEREDDIDLDL